MNDLTKTFRVIIIDDSRPARANIEAQLRGDPEVEVVAQCTNGHEAVEAIQRLRPDILFLEAKTSGQTAFETLANLAAMARPKVVFVTDSKDFALQAFEVHAVDYLLKPFTDERFATALTRAKVAARKDTLLTISSRLDQIMSALQGSPRPAPDAPAPKVREGSGRLFIRSGGEIHMMAPEDIQWIQSDGDYVRIHGTDKPRLVRMPLSKMMQKLDPGLFVRIHRSTAVNLRHMNRATPAPYGEYTVKLANGTKLKVSRTFVRSLKTRL